MVYRLRDFGSYTAGGRLHEVTAGAPYEVNFTRTVSFEVDPRGLYAIEHAYVQYFVPEDRRPGPPVVLVHGGGMSGSCWETTPDGRPGWLHRLLATGYEVHVVDNAERGRAGFIPDLWPGKPMLRTLDEAWALFRIGAAEGFASRTPFPGQLFPAGHLETFARCFAPRWISTTALQVSALIAVLERTGPAIVICHSQGGELTFDAHAKAPQLFHSIIAVEPSAQPDPASRLGQTPAVLCIGDYLDTSEHSKQRENLWRRLARTAQENSEPLCLLDPDTFGPGNSHMMMMDRNSDAVLDRALAALAAL